MSPYLYFRLDTQTNKMMKYLLLLAFVACITAMPMRNELVVKDVDGTYDDAEGAVGDEGERRDGSCCCGGRHSYIFQIIFSIIISNNLFK